MSLMLLWTATDLHVLLYIPQSEECLQHHTVLIKHKQPHDVQKEQLHCLLRQKEDT